MVMVVLLMGGRVGVGLPVHDAAGVLGGVVLLGVMAGSRGRHDGMSSRVHLVIRGVVWVTSVHARLHGHLAVVFEVLGFAVRSDGGGGGVVVESSVVGLIIGVLDHHGAVALLELNRARHLGNCLLGPLLGLHPNEGATLGRAVGIPDDEHVLNVTMGREHVLEGLLGYALWYHANEKFVLGLCCSRIRGGWVGGGGCEDEVQEMPREWVESNSEVFRTQPKHAEASRHEQELLLLSQQEYRADEQRMMPSTAKKIALQSLTRVRPGVRCAWLGRLADLQGPLRLRKLDVVVDLGHGRCGVVGALERHEGAATVRGVVAVADDGHIGDGPVPAEDGDEIGLLAMARDLADEELDVRVARIWSVLLHGDCVIASNPPLTVGGAAVRAG